MRLSTAIVSGGDLPTLLTAIQERESLRTQLQQTLNTQAVASHLGRFDLRLHNRDLRTKIAEWTRLLDALGGNAALARQLSRKLVSGKLAFAPDLETRNDTFTECSSVGWILHGLAAAKALVSPTGTNKRRSIHSASAFIWW
ncbi:MAG TPA: hypothetical protein VK901_21105 [Nitrospiraceae bacterium]|nr:hypothetical protein [Nitrospiraceae bacterium]